MRPILGKVEFAVFIDSLDVFEFCFCKNSD